MRKQLEHIRGLVGAVCMSAWGLALSSTTVSAQVNSWIKPGSGTWDETPSWSLGALPSGSQSVMITNSGWKAVAINPSTPASAMTVSNLTIHGAWDTRNTLLLNFFGTGVPLTVLNGLTLADDGRLVNLNSGLVVEGGTVTVTNTEISQDGGLVRMTNATMNLLKAAYQMTNGVFEGGTVWIGTPFPALPAQFNQYGGTATILNLGLNNQYSLYGGTLDLPGGMELVGRAGGTSYFQAGGTNRTSHVLMEDGYSGSGPNLTLNDGLLAAGSVDVRSGWFGESTFVQNGGTHLVTNALNIIGGATTGATPEPARYYVNGGALSAHAIEMDANQGDSVFMQSNGTAHAETIYAHSVGYYGSFVVGITLANGSLSCSNFILDDGRGNLNQSGGALIVSNLMTISGYRDLNARYYGRFTFTGGTVAASNIDIAAEWVIGDGSNHRISNPGYFSLAHLLQISNAVEQLGRFILVSNATIDLAGSASQLSFANSSGETWASGATLIVANWNGSPSGGGAEQLKFGTSQSGLTAGQLNQIRFSIGSNFYSAKILGTGEVVPGAVITGIAYSRQGNTLVFTWPTGWSLQRATNVAGPYSDVPEATSPYTVDPTVQPQGFFRLRRPE